MNIQANLGNRAGMGPLKSALEAYARRHRVIASNVANAESPGFQASRVEFEEVARKVLAARSGVSVTTTAPGHIGADKPNEAIPSEIKVAEGEEAGVDIERELVSMVQNQLSYRLAVRLLDMKYQQLRTAITSGHR